LASNSTLIGPRRSLVEDTERAHVSEVGGLVVDGRRSRPKYFDGRFLTARDLIDDQRYVQTRHSDLGRAVGWGVVDGLGVRRGPSPGEVVIEVGLGVTPAGETVTITEPITVDLVDLRSRLLVAAHRSAQQKLGLGAGAFVLGVRPVEYTANPRRGYPTEVHGQRTEEDHDIVEATLVTLAPWPFDHPGDADEVRSLLVRDVFVDRTGRAVVPDLLPLAVVYLDRSSLRWLDVHLVRRTVGTEDAVGPGLGLVPRRLRAAHVRQYATHLREIVETSTARDFAAARYFQTLPPVGEMPVAAIERDGFRQRFFPAAVDVDMAVVPSDEMPLLIEESLGLPPIDLLAGDRALEGVSVLVLLPVGRDRFRQFQRALQTVRRPWRIQLPAAALAATRLQGPKRSLALATPSEADTAAWAAVFDHVVSKLGESGLLWYVRRRNLNFRTEIPGFVGLIDLGSLPEPVVPQLLERRVVATEKDEDGDILALRNPTEGWARVSRDEAIADIEAGRHVYYVLEDGRRSEVHVVEGPRGKYLRSEPDETGDNNLDNLPD